MNNQSSERVRVGDLIPDLALPALEGERVNLRHFEGQRWILYMWASW
ncbi:MAG: hypothetical protein R3272_10610 [Candidatus Promineifilaceae bacterium]|nr:hypothetical protein [Candidatus Promineifilaceae bacterium]